MYGIRKFWQIWLHENRSCFLRKEPEKLKAQVTSREKIFTMHITDEKLVSNTQRTTVNE